MVEVPKKITTKVQTRCPMLIIKKCLTTLTETMALTTRPAFSQWSEVQIHRFSTKTSAKIKRNRLSRTTEISPTSYCHTTPLSPCWVGRTRVPSTPKSSNSRTRRVRFLLVPTAVRTATGAHTVITSNPKQTSSPTRTISL